MTRAERIRALRKLYERVPKMLDCRGLCQDSCGPIQCSTLERQVVEKRAGKLLAAPGATCSMLSRNGACTVYGDRPMVCRLFGASEHLHLRCEHGCRPERWLSAEEAGELLQEALRIGGGDLDKLAAAARREILAGLTLEGQQEWVRQRLALIQATGGAQ